MSERDFADFIRILKRHRVRILVIGGYAMAHQRDRGETPSAPFDGELLSLEAVRS